MRTLIAVESVKFQHSITNAGGHLIGNIKPVAVIVRSQEGMYALDLEAKPVDIDQLKQDIPELRSAKGDRFI